MSEHYYSFYSRKTDEFLFGGTAKEISHAGHFATPGTVRSAASRARSGENRRYIVVVDAEPEEMPKEGTHA